MSKASIFDLLTLKVVVRVTCDVGYLLSQMYATDRRQMSDAHHRLMPPPYGGGGIVNILITNLVTLEFIYLRANTSHTVSNSGLSFPGDATEGYEYETAVGYRMPVTLRELGVANAEIISHRSRPLITEWTPLHAHGARITQSCTLAHLLRHSHIASMAHVL